MAFLAVNLTGAIELPSLDVVVVDVVPTRLEKALQLGASAVVDSSREDLAARGSPPMAATGQTRSWPPTADG